MPRLILAKKRKIAWEEDGEGECGERGGEARGRRGEEKRVGGGEEL